MFDAAAERKLVIAKERSDDGEVKRQV